MSRKLFSLTFTAALFGTTAQAEAPSVAVDIAPLHSLVWRVMEGVDVPDLIIPAGASPHHYSMKPSDAKALQDADLVFWIGEDLTPWLEDAMKTLAGDADVTGLLEHDVTIRHDFRESAVFESHDADPEEHEHDDEHDHEEHDEHEEHEDHGQDQSNHGEHDHEGHDPHAWLSPSNAAAWLELIATELADADPGNADVYRANAAAAQQGLALLVQEVNQILDPVRNRSFVVFHDAYQYFEKEFALPASGAIALSDAADPGPARIAEIQTHVRDEGVVCVLAEPQYNPDLVATVLDGTEANTAVIDLIGVQLAPGPNLYAQLIRNMANTLANCL